MSCDRVAVVVCSQLALVLSFGRLDPRVPFMGDVSRLKPRMASEVVDSFQTRNHSSSLRFPACLSTLLLHGNVHGGRYTGPVCSRLATRIVRLTRGGWDRPACVQDLRKRTNCPASD
jgi:hypothetical protein